MIMNRDTDWVCDQCKTEADGISWDELMESRQREIDWNHKVNEIMNEADEYAISVWSELSIQQRSDWANYISKLRIIRHTKIDVELPDPPKRLDTLKM